MTVAIVTAGCDADGGRGRISRRSLNTLPRRASFVATPEVHNPEQAYAASRFAQDRATSYRDVIGSEALAARTVARLRLEESPRDLARKVKVTANPDSVVLKLSVTDSSRRGRDQPGQCTLRRFRSHGERSGDSDRRWHARRTSRGHQERNGGRLGLPDRRKIIGFGVLAGLVLGGVAALLRGPARSRWQRSMPRVRSIDTLHGEVDVATSGGGR